MSKNVGTPLSITISGASHSGKTNLAVFLMKALKAYGFEEVSLICDDTGHGVGTRLMEEDYIERIKREYPDVLKAPVTIYEAPVFAAPDIANAIACGALDASVPKPGSKVTLKDDAIYMGATISTVAEIRNDADRDYLNIWAAAAARTSTPSDSVPNFQGRLNSLEERPSGADAPYGYAWVIGEDCHLSMGDDMWVVFPVGKNIELEWQHFREARERVVRMNLLPPNILYTPPAELPPKSRNSGISGEHDSLEPKMSWPNLTGTPADFPPSGQPHDYEYDPDDRRPSDVN